MANLQKEHVDVIARNAKTAEAMATAKKLGYQVSVDQLPCSGMMRRSSNMIALRYKIEHQRVGNAVTTHWAMTDISYRSDEYNYDFIVPMILTNSYQFSGQPAFCSERTRVKIGLTLLHRVLINQHQDVRP
jgi:hypothetical protein